MVISPLKKARISTKKLKIPQMSLHAFFKSKSILHDAMVKNITIVHVNMWAKKSKKNSKSEDKRTKNAP